jgi:RNA polymerase sigma factor for flagellar operon FliA
MPTKEIEYRSKTMMTVAQQAYAKATGLDAQQREQLLMEQLPQVRYIAKRIHERLPDHVALDDLIQAGVLGLIEAMEKYDPGKNVQLKSYAKFRIRGAILDSLRDLDWSPRSLRREARRIEAAQTHLRDTLGRMPGEHEVAEQLGLELSEYQRLLGEVRGLDIGSLFVESSEDGDEAMERDVPAPADQDPFQLCMETEQREVLAEAISELSEREQQVLSLYYFEELTMKEVGAVLGVVESRVSQIHTAALIALRGRLKSKIGRKLAAAAR